MDNDVICEGEVKVDCEEFVREEEGLVCRGLKYAVTMGDAEFGWRQWLIPKGVRDLWGRMCGRGGQGDSERSRRGRNGESGNQTILNGVSFMAKPREVLAILGPSGSGKTSLITAIGGRTTTGHLDGVTLYNGRPLTRGMKHQVSIVTQEDVFFTNLTVGETLDFTARTRLPDNMSREDRQNTLREVTTSLGIQGILNTIIGDYFKKGISGGERKRLNIACELLTNPKFLFLDEPTSGLDSGVAWSLMKQIRKLSREDRVVITTVHQPNSQMFGLFDKLLFLVDGEVCYFGPAQRVSAYLDSLGLKCPATFNPADYMMQVITFDGSNPEGAEKVRKKLKDNWKLVETTQEGSAKSSANSRRLFCRERSQYTTSVGRQYVALCRRSFKQRRGETAQLINLIQHISLAFIVSSLWFQISDTEASLPDRLGVFFFTTAFWGFTPMFAAIFSYPLERSVLQKDLASSAYRLACYSLAKATVEVPVEIFYPTLYWIIVYFMVGLNGQIDRFFISTVVLTIHVLASQSIGGFIAVLVNDLKIAQVVATLSMLGSLLFGGFYVTTNRVPAPLRPLKWISPVQYAYSALVINDISGHNFTCDAEYPTVYSQGGTNCPVTDSDILWASSIDDSLGVAGDAIILFCFVLFFRLAAYGILRYRHY
mmetsp:Transcript_4705/g.9502  ORF Transcript_4705/g.9502 Transcript_4705/m.9502 type:complete len:654 (+) Transcript_4705:93-2054(+)